MLSKKHLKNVCLCHQGSNQCRYLAESDVNYNVWVCAKKTSKKDVINEQIRKHMSEGLDPYKQGLPMGDNCQGYLKLDSIEQGYDVD